MATAAPAWLNPPQPKWLACSIEGKLEPGEYAVQIDIDGKEVAAAVPCSSVRAPANLPNEGGLRVIVVAELAGERVLADLPAAPLNGTRRISVVATRLMDDWNAAIRP